MREIQRVVRRRTGSEGIVHLPQTALLRPAVGGWGAAAAGRGRRGRPLPPANSPTPSGRGGGIPRRRWRLEPARRLLPPQRPGGAADWGRGAPLPLPSPSPAGGGSSPGLPYPVACFWFHFPRPGLSPSPFPQPFEFLAPALSGLSSRVTSSRTLSWTTLTQASLLSRPILFSSRH